MAELGGTVGRPALLWRMQRGGHSMECLGAATQDGRFRVWLARDGHDEASASFTDPTDGIRWSLTREHELTEAGWTKVP